MNDELVGSARAASLLGISGRYFQKMVRGGIIRPHPTASPSTLKNRLFRMTDVAALHEIRARGRNPETAFVEARQSALESRALRREVDRLKFLLGLDTPALGVDRDSVVSIVLKAEDALRGPPIRDPDTLLYWGYVLHALSEAHFEAITFHTDAKEPWRVFLALGRRLCAHEDIGMTRNDPELHSVYRIVNAALQRARRTAYFHVRALYGKEYSANLFPKVKSCPHEDVIAMSFNNMTWEAPKRPITTPLKTRPLWPEGVGWKKSSLGAGGSHSDE